MEEVLGIPKVEGFALGFCRSSWSELCLVPRALGWGWGWGRTCIKHVLEFLDMAHGAGLSVDALNAQAKQLDGLDALLHNQGHGEAITLI